MADSTNGLYKTELIYSQPAWVLLTEVDCATLNWAHWRNTARLHENLGQQPTAEVENASYEQRTESAPKSRD
ncbi:integrase core domain-containing protein [Nesterenkonia cremea]|uniref:integrase core domain-containing protein n=1 Tax=Nesterenkonia cremea TaxID=1882340 RepID=UPI003571124F